MNLLVRTFIEFMDYAAIEGEIEAGRCIHYSLRNVRKLKKSALRQLVALRDEAEKFDNRRYSETIQNVLALAPEHPEKRATMMRLFHEYCRFQCGLKLLGDEPEVSDLLQENDLEALTELEPDDNSLRPYGEELVNIFETTVASGAPCTGPEYCEQVEIVACTSLLYGIELSDAMTRVVCYHNGEQDEGPTPSGSPTPLQ
jgi:hypothetical protein